MNTKSENLFEAFLTAHSVRFSRIEEMQNKKGARRPDYLLENDGLKIIFEVKQLGDDDDAERAQLNGDWSSTPGAVVRQVIARSKKQIQFGAEQVIPSVLLIYNNTDPMFQTRGTDDFDFKTGMFGELTKLIDRHADQSSEFFHGRKSELQEDKNTSFSAVGHLCDRAGTTSVKLWENAYAKIPLAFDRLPACLAVQRIAIDNSPLRFT